MGERALVISPLSAKLVKVGSVDRSIVGWSYKGFEAHLLGHHDLGTWCDVACGARTMFLRDTARNEKAIRQRLRGAQRKFIDTGRFLAVTYGARGAAMQFKIFDAAHATESELQAAVFQLERMRTRGEVTYAYYETARANIGL